jgi:hypothetical protein
MQRNMKAILKSLTLMAIFAAVSHAAFPTEDMDIRSLGLQYGLAFRGQNITNANIPSYETIHTLSLGYAPIPYVEVEAGIGLDALTVQTTKSVGFRGEYGFSPSFGLVLSSPYFADLVRVTGGVRALYLNSEDSKGFRYSGLISSPFLGAVLSPSGYCDVELGGRMHLVDGTMQGPGGSEQPFANQDAFRGYLGVTLKSPSDRVFLTLDMDASPDFDSDWSHGPREAQVGVSFGAMLGWKKQSNAGQDSSAYFPDFPALKEKLKKMAGELE